MRPIASGARQRLAQVQMLRAAGIRRRRLCALDRRAPSAIGSLVLGYYEGGKLRYAGRVGTGFTRASSRATSARSTRSDPHGRELAASPTGCPPRRAATCAGSSRAGGRGRVSRLDRRRIVAPCLVQGSARGQGRPQRVVAGSEAEPMKAEAASAAPRSTLTHPDRRALAGCRRDQAGPRRLLRRDLAVDAPHVVGRPLALVRCPGGIRASASSRSMPGPGLSERYPARSRTREGPARPALSIDDLEGLIGLAQAGVLEIHPWGAPVGDSRRPDALIFDLDPAPRCRLAGVDRRRAGGARAACKRSASRASSRPPAARGCTSCAPLKPHADWAAAKAFATGLADGMAARRARNRFLAQAAEEPRGRRSSSITCATAAAPPRSPPIRRARGRRPGVDAARLGRAGAGDAPRSVHGLEPAASARAPR